MYGLIEEISLQKEADKAETLYTALQRKAKSAGVPIVGVFELTPLCNLDCKMCYVHLSKDQVTQPLLTTDQWIGLIDDACDAGMMFATLTGGECLTYPGFREIYEHMQDRGVLVSVFTNGVLMNRELIDWLAQRPPRRVQISVYGSCPDAYEKVTGSKTAFDMVDRALDDLKRSGIAFSIAITASAQMTDDFESLYRYCKEKDPHMIGLSTLPLQARSGTDRQYHDFAPSLDDQVKLYRTRMRVDGVDSIMLRNRPASSARERATVGVLCAAGISQFAIKWNGEMIPCSGFEFVTERPLQTGFLMSWSDMHDKALNYRLPVECVDCDIYDACTHCPAVHWQVGGEGHVNPFACEEGRRMLAEGFRNM